MHKINSEEQAIPTWKNNLLLGLYGVGKISNAPMVPHTQTIPNNIEPLKARKIKSKTVSSNVIEGGF